MAIQIRPEYSAQASIFQPNPLLEASILQIQQQYLGPDSTDSVCMADQGCGKLRHLAVYRKHYNNILLVDTDYQLSRKQRLYNKDNISIREYIDDINDKFITAITVKEFEKARLSLDIIFSVCVFDVVPPKTRYSMARAAAQNLKDDGLYIVIIPRNDTSILRRCSEENEYLDGHYFQHHGVTTFFRNYRDSQELVSLFTKYGFTLESDFSVHKQIWLILSKAS